MDDLARVFESELHDSLPGVRQRLTQPMDNPETHPDFSAVVLEPPLGVVSELARRLAEEVKAFFEDETTREGSSCREGQPIGAMSQTSRRLADVAEAEEDAEREASAADERSESGEGDTLPGLDGGGVVETPAPDEYGVDPCPLSRDRAWCGKR